MQAAFRYASSAPPWYDARAFRAACRLYRGAAAKIVSLNVIAFDRHCNHGSDPGEGVNHGGDDHSVAKTDNIRHMDILSSGFLPDDARLGAAAETGKGAHATFRILAHQKAPCPPMRRRSCKSHLLHRALCRPR